ncbi:MAG: TerC family protein [Phycisphaerales bacterium]|nr:TerC family protein [Phycisphaerales bacterium]
MDWTALLTVENGIALVTLSAMEIVLGIDNIIFISILTGRLPPEQRRRGRLIGLALAMIMRIALLFTITWIMALTYHLFTVPEVLAGGEPHELTMKDLVLLGGGLFLIVKAVREIHHKIEGGESAAGEHPDPARHLGHAGFGSTIAQIVAIDIVFSLDSVITAVGMVEQPKGSASHGPLAIMATAVVIAVLVMMLVAGRISDFVEKHPTIKMLALSFLLLIGVMLVGESFGREIPKGYIYFAMAFSLGVEMLNLRMSRKAKATA